MNWLNDFEQAKEEAVKTRKPILLQFEREKCSGCKKLYALTYPDNTVQAELGEWFVPLQLDILQNRKLRSQLSAIWTPSFYVLDWREKLYFSHDGYLNVEDFRVLLRIAYIHFLLPRGKYQEAIDIVNEAVELFPNNPKAPSLLFLRGKAEYLHGWDKPSFQKTMLEIIENYPESQEARMWPWMDD